MVIFFGRHPQHYEAGKLMLGLLQSDKSQVVSTNLLRVNMVKEVPSLLFTIRLQDDLHSFGNSNRVVDGDNFCQQTANDPATRFLY